MSIACKSWVIVRCAQRSLVPSSSAHGISLDKIKIDTSIFETVKEVCFRFGKYCASKTTAHILGVFWYSKSSIAFLKFPRSTATDSVYNRIAPYYMIQYYGRISPWPNTGKYDRHTASCKSSYFPVNNRLRTCKFDLGYPHALHSEMSFETTISWEIFLQKLLDY